MKETKRRSIQRPSEGLQNSLQPRIQETYEVTKRDLEDLSAFDTFQISLISIGQFFLSGSIWLGAEKMIEAQTRNPFHDGITTLCAVSAAAGSVLIGFGYLAWRVKKGKLASIYDEAS